MNSNEERQNIKKPEKKQKKTFLSNFIEVEEEPKKEKLKKEKPKKAQIKPKTKSKVKSPKKEKIVEKKIKGDKDSQLTEEEKLLLNTGEGVNLIPKRSKAEVKKEKKKISFSISSMISLVVLVLLSLGVVFFNIISKQQLNSAKEDLYEGEAELGVYSDKILSNSEILARTDLYKFLEKGVFSPKEILEYVLNVTDRSGNITIRTFDIGNDLSFEMSGSTSDLAVVAKLWYLLGIDENIENINLESVGKNDKGASFSFRGQLNTSKFIGN